MDVVRITAGDRNDKYPRAALVLRTIGWLSICWGFMISIYIWMGERAGSHLWLWWTVGQLAFGAICLAIAKHLQTRAAHFAGRTDLEIEDEEHRRVA